MTDTTVRCDECESLVELIRDKTGKLQLVCDCGEMRAIKVARKTPEGWN